MVLEAEELSRARSFVERLMTMMKTRMMVECTVRLRIDRKSFLFGPSKN
jgi:hypothetical protein